MLKNPAESAQFLEAQVKAFVDHAVIGVSGGIDSSVVAAICVAALGKQNVTLVSMPYNEIDIQTFNARSHELAEQLRAQHLVVHIQSACMPIELKLAEIFPGQALDRLTLANIRPRVRMNVLYSISGEIGYKTGKRVRVMGTGHLSEDIIGYDTKGGDALCDIFILSDLVKSEVYQLGKYYQLPESIIQAEPSAGLYEGQTDEQELGFRYEELEGPTLAVHSLIKRGFKPEEISVEDSVFSAFDQRLSRFVVQRYQAHFHKHLAPATVAFPREDYCI